jgi:DNA polymerase-3 subunit epsilon/oligoribonuclease
MLAIFLDLESTGLDACKHKVIEIAFKIYDVFSGQLITAYSSVVKHPYTVWEERDLSSILINGFEWETIDQQGKEIPQVREEIIRAFTEAGVARGKAVFVCQNPAFDRSFFVQLVDIYTQENLNWPYHWLDFASMYWALMMQNPHLEPFSETNLSKDEIAKSFDLPPEAKPHRAMNGVDHLILCYQTVVGFGGRKGASSVNI